MPTSVARLPDDLNNVPASPTSIPRHVIPRPPPRVRRSSANARSSARPVAHALGAAPAASEADRRRAPPPPQAPGGGDLLLPSFSARATRHALGTTPGPADDAAGRRRPPIGAIPRRSTRIFDTSIPEENASLFPPREPSAHPRPAEHSRPSCCSRSGDIRPSPARGDRSACCCYPRYLRGERPVPVIPRHGRRRGRDNGNLDAEPRHLHGRKGDANTLGFAIEELNLLGRGTSSLERKPGHRPHRHALPIATASSATAGGVSASIYSDNSDGKGEGPAARPRLLRAGYALGRRAARSATTTGSTRATTWANASAIPRPVKQGLQSATAVARPWSTATCCAGPRASLRRPALLGRLPLTTLPTVPPPDRKLVYPWIAAEWLQDDFRGRNRDQIRHRGLRVWLARAGPAQQAK